MGFGTGMGISVGAGVYLRLVARLRRREAEHGTATYLEKRLRGELAGQATLHADRSWRGSPVSTTWCAQLAVLRYAG
jgi:hypothetical protein